MALLYCMEGGGKSHAAFSDLSAFASSTTLGSSTHPPIPVVRDGLSGSWIPTSRSTRATQAKPSPHELRSLLEANLWCEGWSSTRCGSMPCSTYSGCRSFLIGVVWLYLHVLVKHVESTVWVTEPRSELMRLLNDLVTRADFPGVERYQVAAFERFCFPSYK